MHEFHRPLNYEYDQNFVEKPVEKSSTCLLPSDKQSFFLASKRHFGVILILFGNVELHLGYKANICAF